MQFSRKIPALLLVIAVLAGCGTRAHPLDEQIRASGEFSAQTTADLQRGQKMIADGADEIALGEKEQKRARKLADSGDDHVADGRSMVSQGEALVSKARQEYCARVAYQSEACRKL